jgi:hypothetical protein
MKPDVSPDRIWRNPMKYLIRAAYMALSLIYGIPQVAAAAPVDNGPAPVQQTDTASWANG